QRSGGWRRMTAIAPAIGAGVTTAVTPVPIAVRTGPTADAVTMPPGIRMDARRHSRASTPMTRRSTAAPAFRTRPTMVRVIHEEIHDDALCQEMPRGGGCRRHASRARTGGNGGRDRRSPEGHPRKGH